MFSFRISLQALDAAVGTIHSDIQAIADVAAGTCSTHDGGFEQGVAHDGSVAVQAGLLNHQSGGIADIAQHLVGGGGNDQHHAGAELCLDLLQSAADAGLAAGGDQIGLAAAHAYTGARQLPTMWILIMLVVPETPTGTPAVTTASSPLCR